SDSQSSQVESDVGPDVTSGRVERGETRRICADNRSRSVDQDVYGRIACPECCRIDRAIKETCTDDERIGEDERIRSLGPRKAGRSTNAPRVIEEKLR